ncbi:hypothetical protein FGO68_gene7091 [Halteria grandinella]|uniref:Uncharacterized protein n=1 Tax=Halteria grandinella TaxID=5974 RepID=A0A8J8NAI4_HALGN|nr:hypothetical protein FGO68_gene7091 [Halteria grandinella]
MLCLKNLCFGWEWRFLFVRVTYQTGEGGLQASYSIARGCCFWYMSSVTSHLQGFRLLDLLLLESSTSEAPLSSLVISALIFFKSLYLFMVPWTAPFIGSALVNYCLLIVRLSLSLSYFICCYICLFLLSISLAIPSSPSSLHIDQSQLYYYCFYASICSRNFDAIQSLPFLSIQVIQLVSSLWI